MKIAAQTIGLDLVAVKPAASPRIELLFVDFRYDDKNNESTDRPLVFKITSSNVAQVTTGLYAQMSALAITEMVGGLDQRTFVAIAGIASGLTGAVTPSDIQNFDPTNDSVYSKAGWMEFLGFSRIDGDPMFRIFRQAFEAGSYNITGFDGTKNTFPLGTASVATQLSNATLITLSGSTTAPTLSSVLISGTCSLSLVSVMEDHIPGFSANWNLFQGMVRQEDETTYPGIIGPNVFTRSIQVGDVEITSALKRTQIEDIKASTGMDIVQKLESVLINELSQTISKSIVAQVRDLGEKNRVSHQTPVVNGIPKFDFNVNQYLAGTVPQGETTYTLQRKLASKINNASNYIANEGRIGPAQYAVTNGNLASVLQDVANNTLVPMVGGSNLNTNGQLYPVGKIGNMSLYVDPNMRWDDNRIFLGRKNSVDQPGLLFLPYLMAQSISIISEQTWAPRMMIRSRYAIADVGFFPEKQFMAIHVTDTNGYLI